MNTSKQIGDEIFIRKLNEDFHDFHESIPGMSDKLKQQCKNIRAAYEFIGNLSDEEAKRITFTTIAKAIGLTVTSSEDPVLKTNFDLIQAVIGYLVGERTKVLNLNLEFIDGDFRHELTASEMENFSRKRQFNDPRSGSKIENCESRLFVYFSLNHAKTRCHQ